MKTSFRLDKYLADMSVGTRSEVKNLIKKGLVTVNGEVIRKPEYKVDIEKDDLVCRGEPVVYQTLVYYMLNKPAGVISATNDPKQQTVLDLITDKSRKDLFPVGRLDKDTVGLLLITNDGNLAHRLLSPKHHVDKCYFAKVQGNVTKDDAEKFAEGVNIGTEDEPEITMFQAVGKEVVYLKRERMGSLILDDNLAEGEYRMLTEEELKNLLF